MNIVYIVSGHILLFPNFAYHVAFHVVKVPVKGFSVVKLIWFISISELIPYL